MPRARLSPFCFVVLLAIVVACEPSLKDPDSPRGAETCSARSIEACEDELAKAISLGEGIATVATSYSKARKERDGGDAFASAVVALTAEAKGGVALAMMPEAKDPGGAPELPRVTIGAVAPIGKSIGPEVLFVALAEAAGLDYLAVVRADGSLVRAYGRDPAVYFMAGLPPALVDDDPRLVDGDVAIETSLRVAVEKAAALDYVGASDAVDALEKAAEAEPQHDGQTLRARLLAAMIGLSAAAPLLEASAKPPRPAEIEPRPFESAYYDMLRVRMDRPAAKAYAKRKDRLIAAAPQEMRELIDRTWGAPSDACTVLLPPSFDRPRDLGFAFLLPPTLLPAGARDTRGRLSLAEWYPRYEKLVALVERTKTFTYAALVLVTERGHASSILPTGADAHRRVDEILLKHARALEDLARVKPGRLGIGQLAFIASPATYSSDTVRKGMHSLTRVVAQGTLAQAKDSWDILANTFAGLLLSGNMPGDVREEQMLALAGAFTAKLEGDLKKQTGWGVAIAYGADLIYRTIGGLSPNPSKSTTEIARALETDPTIVEPGLAALASALARYAALAPDGSLGTPIVGEGGAMPPARSAARASLKSALSRLAAGASPDPRALAELASFADNAAASLATAIAGTKPKAAPASQGDASCQKEEEAALDPRLVRAIGKLRDQRKNLLGLKQLKSGTDAWSKRARLVALVLSDALDVTADRALPKKKAAKAKAETPTTIAFFVSAADSEKILDEALATFGAEGPVVTAVENAYALTRGFFADGVDYLAGVGLGKARELLKALSPLISEPGDLSKAGGLLVGLASALGDGGATTPQFVEVARGLYEKGQTDEADMILIAAVVASALTDRPFGPEAFDVAQQKGSAMAWLFDFLRYAKSGKETAPLPQPRFKAGLDALLVKKCATASTTMIVDVLDAIERFRRGEREKARADLDAALEKGAENLVLPHVSFSFKQETTTRVVNLSVDIALAAPFVSSTGGLNVGGGVKTAGEPKLELEVAVDSADTKRARDDAARYYVHASAIAAVFHFLSNDPTKGERAAARSLGSVLQRTFLYQPGVSDEPIQFMEGAHATIAILAQQAIDAERPLLAGSFLQVLRASYDGRTTSTADLVAILDHLPKPLQGIADLEPVVERAKKTLGLLSAGYACVGPKLDKAFLLKPSCGEYPQAVALRVADSLAAMPALAGGGKGGAACADHAALDGFLVAAQGGKYEPEKFVAAVDRMLASKKIFEATFLLSRPRDPSHCTDGVISSMRKTADALEGVPTFRADLFTAIVNCQVGAPLDVLTADLAALDRELDRVGDASRQIQIGLFAAALASRRGEASLVETVVKKKGFLEQHRKNGPLLPLALLLDHVASNLAGNAPDVEGTAKDVDFLCGMNDQPAGAETCKLLRLMRQDGVDAAQRKRVAEDVLKRLSPR